MIVSPPTGLVDGVRYPVPGDGEGAEEEEDGGLRVGENG